MKGRVIALDRVDGREAAALMEDGRLQDFLIEPTGEAPPAPGAIFRALCDRPLKGQGGMMMRLPGGQSGFLRRVKGLSPGQPLLVQVTGYGEPGKAVPLTAKVLFKSRYAIVTPEAPGINISRAIRDEDLRDALLEIAHEAMAGSDFGLILRSASADAGEEEIAADITAMRDLAERIMGEVQGSGPEHLLEGPSPHELAWREWPMPDILADAPGAFADHGIREALDGFLEGPLPLPGGASMWIEPTRALVAVDVNTGGDTSPAAGLKANLAAARDLPRALRILGLGGQITVDFAPMAKKDRRTLETALRAAFRSDTIETALVGWTPLGHHELQRKRERLPIAEHLKI